MDAKVWNRESKGGLIIKPSDDRRYDIEGLRTFAIAEVLLFHFFPNWFPGGYVGVDVFFVISGYVVTLSIVRRADAGQFTFVGFYARRIRRLFPALTLVSIACLLASWAFQFQAEFADLGLEILLTSFYVINFKFAAGSGYFDVAAAASPVLHFWSLAVEEQFYLVWPLVLLLIFTVSMPCRVALVALGIAFSFLLNLVITRYWPEYSFFMFPTRAWEFAVGGSIALFSFYLPQVKPSWNNILSIIGLSIIIGTLFSLGDEMTYGTWRTSFAVISSGLLIVTRASLANTYLLANRAMVWIGFRSYPIYLWHWPPIAFYKLLTGSDLPVITGIMFIALIIVASDLTYRYVERPFWSGAERSSWRLRHRQLAVPFLMAVSLITGAMGGLAWRGYLPERLLSLRPILAAREDWVYSTDLVIPGTTTDTLLLFGDSYIEQYIPRFQQLSNVQGPRLQIEVLITGGCAPIPLINRRSRPNCLPFSNRGYEMSLKPHVRKVLFGASWVGLISRGDYFDPISGNLVDPRSKSAIFVWREFEERLRMLVANGKRVYLMLNPPGGSKADPAWIARHFTGGTLSISITEHDDRVGDINAMLSLIAARAGVTVLDPRTWLCNNEGCPVTTADGIPIFASKTHLRASYARDKVTPLDALILPDR